MDNNQSFSLNADFLSDFSSMFMKLVYVIILVYLILMILNFLRDKFINKEVVSKKADIIDLLTILNKLFFISGFGFVIGNIFNIIMSLTTRNHNSISSMNLKGNWAYLTFGIIIIFIGLGFKSAKKILNKEKPD